jgi:putative transposase
MMSSDMAYMECRELRHDRHMVSLLTDHMVFSPKQPREILAGVVALALDGIIRKTCKDLNIEIIDMAVNVDRVHLLEYPPKYSVSYIAKRMKGRSSRELREAFPHLKEWAGIGLWTPSCFHGSVGHGREVVERYIQNQEAPNAKSLCAGSVLKSGVW